MMARAQPELRAAAVSAAGCADAGGDLPRRIEELTEDDYNRGAAGGLGVARPTTWRRSARGSASS